MNLFKTIIIDDEPIARKRLIQLLDESSEQIKIIAEAKNGIEGAELINQLKPDLIFLDVQMPGKTGFEMLEDLEHIPCVVFCTAYEEYALQAFDTLAVDYLVKPVEKDRLELTLDKINRASGNSQGLQINELINLVKQQSEVKILQSIPHRVGDRIILIKVDDIAYFSSNEKYVEFYSNNGEKYLTEMSLKKLIDRLPNNFCQVHRGIIVNLNIVKEYRKYFRGKYILVLNDRNSTRLETSRRYSDVIRNHLTID